jgi:cbb3-type cytochrome oxidase subunit 3
VAQAISRPIGRIFRDWESVPRLRQFFGTIFFAILFTALSFIQIRKDAAKIVAEATGMSPGALVFLGYFCAAYAAMTALLDLSRLANALIKKTV